MRSSLLVLSAAVSSVLGNALPQASATGGLPLGAACDPATANVCAGGAQCYATNFMLIPSCGNFQASCTTDAQCAFNTCNNGLCNGFKTTPVPMPTPVDPTPSPSRPKPTGTNLPLGSDCDPALTNACAGGASCYATNSMLIPRCGNFQATCTSNAQCAFNSCNNGFCNGEPAPVPLPTPVPLPLGAVCEPSIVNVCAGGAQCYATNSMLIPRCGNFQAACTGDSQCAYNKCNNGFCNGALISSSSAAPQPTPSGSSSSSIVTRTSSQPPVGIPTPPTYSNSTITTVSRPAPTGGATTTSAGARPTFNQSNGAGKLVGSGVMGAIALGLALLL